MSKGRVSIMCPVASRYFVVRDCRSNHRSLANHIIAPLRPSVHIPCVLTPSSPLIFSHTHPSGVVYSLSNPPFLTICTPRYCTPLLPQQRTRHQRRSLFVPSPHFPDPSQIHLQTTPPDIHPFLYLHTPIFHRVALTHSVLHSLSLILLSRQSN